MVLPRPPGETAASLPGERLGERPGDRPANRRSRRRRREPAEDAGRQTARRTEERRRQRIAIIIGVALILAIVAIVAVGYYREFYHPPRVLAGQVRDVRFSMGGLVDRIRVLQGINRYEQGGRVDLSIVPFRYLQDMIHAEILRQAAPGLGFSVTDEDIGEELRRRFRPVPPEGQEVDEGQLDQEYENALTNFKTSTNLSDAEYRVLVEEELLRRQLFIVINSSLPEQVEQVEAAWIRLEAEGPVEPQEVRDRLEREDFALVASEVHRSAGFTNQQGYAGWVPEEAFPDLDDALFGDPNRKDREGNDNPLPALPVGEISDPIYAQDGTYIVHKISGLEERELSGIMSFQLTRKRVDQWFEEQLSRGSDEGWVKIKFHSEVYSWVADQVQISAPRIEQPPPGQPAGPGFP